MKPYHSQFIYLLLLFIGTLPIAGQAQTWDYVPVGPRSIAMGGTGIAVSSSSEAFTTNPALIGWDGLTSLSLAIRVRSAEVVRSDSDGLLVDGTTTRSHLAALALPIPALQDRFTFGIAHTRPVEPIFMDYGFDGGVEMISPSFSMKVLDGWRIGAAFNIWAGKITWDGDHPDINPPVYNREDGSIVSESTWKDIELTGLNATIGTQVTLFEYYEQHKVYLGAKARLPFKLTSDPNSMHIVNGFPYVLDGEEDIDMPLTAGLGLGWLINNRITVTTDFEYRIWDEPYEYKYTVGFYGIPYDHEETFAVSNVDHTWQLGAGAEYAIPFEQFEIPLRMGYRYFTMPFRNDDDSVVGGEVLSLGTGFRTELFQLDLAYSRSQALQAIPLELSNFRAAEPHVSYGYGTVVAGATVNLSELW